MKAFLSLALIFFSVSSFADTTAIENFLYDGTQEVRDVNLSTEKTKTEYRTVRVPATCYRTTYRRHCSQRPPTCRTVCDRNGNCRNRCSGGGTVCRQVPVRTPYTCWRNETRGYQVHDYFVETNVKIHVLNEDLSNNPQEKFKIKMRGDSPSFGVTASSNYFVYLDKKTKRESMQSGTKFIDLVYKVRLISAESAKLVLSNGITGVKLKNGVLNFRLGAGFNLEDFSQKIRIYRARRLRTDPLLLTKMLTNNEMNVQTINNASHIAINLRNLGINLPSNMRVILDTTFKMNEDKLLNKGQIRTKASTNWIFR